MKGRVGLARAGGHYEQDAVLAVGNGFYRAVDGDKLIVARRLLRTPDVVILCRHDNLLLGKSFGGAIAGPKVFRSGKLIERDFPCYRAAGGHAVVFEKGVSIAAVGEGDIKNLGVFEGLLHAVPDRVVVVFGFDDGNGQVRLVVEKIVSLLGFSAPDGFAPDNNPALCEVSLLPELGYQIPASTLGAAERRRDELGPDIRFGEGFFVHALSINGIRLFGALRRGFRRGFAGFPARNRGRRERSSPSQTRRDHRWPGRLWA